MLTQQVNSKFMVRSTTLSILKTKIKQTRVTHYLVNFNINTKISFLNKCTHAHINHVSNVLNKNMHSCRTNFMVVCRMKIRSNKVNVKLVWLRREGYKFTKNECTSPMYACTDWKKERKEVCFKYTRSYRSHLNLF